MIEINELGFSYPGQKGLFKDLSIELESGSITGLLGRNGAGKSTLLRLMTGLLFARSGSIKVLGHFPFRREVSFLNNVYFVPEEFTLPSIEIKKYIDSYASFYPNFDEELLNRLLMDFELDPANKLHRFSLGQKKKFQIAFALATRCRLLLLDEPTNGLDIPSKSLFRKIIAGSLDENQLVIISTHQARDIESIIDRIIILDEGRMIFKKTVSEISEKVSFITGTSEDLSRSIYSETVPGGYRHIIPKDHIETEVDIELLFNAVINGKTI
ncbi:MAG TPA: ABC transporter ATP-binding protein [Bacteroidales bacterium]|nr:ABC transporter ATP-binding protein [Bacteroidales bacterium]HPT22434.1 ABC transporter ATP-binding protein [Bacteroidales bacterium]